MTHWGSGGVGGGWKDFRSAHADVQSAVDLLQRAIKSKLLCKESRSVCSGNSLSSITDAIKYS